MHGPVLRTSEHPRAYPSSERPPSVEPEVAIERISVGSSDTLDRQGEANCFERNTCERDLEHRYILPGVPRYCRDDEQ